MSAISPLFDEAWERRRRRRERGRAACAAAALGLAALTAVAHRSAPASPSVAPIRHEPASQLLSGGSYLAIHCPQPNSIACDQLALAITLRRPAQAVTVTIDGHSWPMNRRGDVIYRSDRPRREFDGYLSHAGIVSRLHVHPEEPGDVFVQRQRTADTRARRPARAPGVR